MFQKLTHEEVINRLKKLHSNIDFSEFTYISAKSHSKCICKICNHVWYPMYRHLIQKHGCPKCSGNIMPTLDEMLNNLKLKFPNIDFTDFKPKNSKDKSICKCNKHNYIFEKNYKSLIKSQFGCPICIKESIKTKRFPKEKYLEKLIKKFPNIDFINFVYNDYLTKSECRCKIHNHVFQASYCNLMSVKYGCPKCSCERLEKVVSEKLDELKIIYEIQKKFDTCKYKRKLPFDFYLKKYNLLIEVDGIRHFNQEYQSYQMTKIRDSIKTKWAKKNNIKLIRVSDYKLKTKEHITIKQLFIFLEKLIQF